MRQLNVHKLVENLNELCNTLVDRYCINYGGCCYVAYEIAKHLDRFHIGYKLCISNNFRLNQKEITQEVRNKCSNKGTNSVSGSNTCCHYYLTVSGGGPVNEGDSSDEYYTYVIAGINHRNLNWLYRTSYWNSVYEKKNNKLIKKIISLHFKQYGKASKDGLRTSKSNSMSKMQICC